jgi:hypothetical protein
MKSKKSGNCGMLVLKGYCMFKAIKSQRSAKSRYIPILNKRKYGG